MTALFNIFSEQRLKLFSIFEPGFYQEDNFSDDHEKNDADDRAKRVVDDVVELEKSAVKVQLRELYAGGHKHTDDYRDP